ncbi:MAG: hypothetical protein VX969_00720, partial [Verrucomicrobiota bacterium]|nr:hypothetical protein [Verrucomicrobiota bacterium]
MVDSSRLHVLSHLGDRTLFKVEYAKETFHCGITTKGIRTNGTFLHEGTCKRSIFRSVNLDSLL